jgi:hypothetical protein
MLFDLPETCDDLLVVNYYFLAVFTFYLILNRPLNKLKIFWDNKKNIKSLSSSVKYNAITSNHFALYTYFSNFSIALMSMKEFWMFLPVIANFFRKMNSAILFRSLYYCLLGFKETLAEVPAYQTWGSEFKHYQKLKIKIKRVRLEPCKSSQSSFLKKQINNKVLDSC